MRGGGDAANADGVSLVLQQLLQVFHTLHKVVDHPLNLWTHGFTRRGQAHMVGTAVKQRGAQQCFQLSDGRRERWLAHGQRLRGPAKAAMGSDFFEATQLSQRRRRRRFSGQLGVRHTSDSVSQDIKRAITLTFGLDSRIAMTNDQVINDFSKVIKCYLLI